MGNSLETLELLDFYGKKFQKIRVDRAHGVAPHKPILLLSVLERIQKHRKRPLSGVEGDAGGGCWLCSANGISGTVTITVDC